MGRSTLKEFLEAADHDRMALSFRQVEVLLGGDLPASLQTHDGWKTPHPDAVNLYDELSQAGFAPTEVDLVDRRVVLQRTIALNEDGLEAADGVTRIDEVGRRRRRHPAFGALKGVFTVEPGYDLTQSPFEPEWLKETYGD